MPGPESTQAKKKKTLRHHSALKAHRKSLKLYAKNRAAKRQIRSALKEAMKAAQAKEGQKAGELMGRVQSLVDKAARKGVIHWKAAARKKARWLRQMRAKAQPAASAVAAS